jgi:hypothetical protein
MIHPFPNPASSATRPGVQAASALKPRAAEAMPIDLPCLKSDVLAMLPLLRLLPALFAAVLVSCAVHTKECPPDAVSRACLNESALQAILKQGADGDWLVVRQYHKTDNFIATVRNSPLSHAAVLDLKNRRVIQANSEGTHVTALTDFIAGCHRILLIRPKWSSPANRKAALAEAEALIGRKYDYLGLLGIDIPRRFYCSELALHIYRQYQKPSDLIPHPAAPDQLYFYGRILYDSGAF